MGAGGILVIGGDDFEMEGVDTPLKSMICSKFNQKIYIKKINSQINITLRLARLTIPVLGLISSYL